MLGVYDCEVRDLVLDVCEWQTISHSVLKEINGTHFRHTKLIIKYEKKYICNDINL